MHNQLFAILMGPLLTPSATCSTAASCSAATASTGERPLLAGGAALRAALPELPCLSSAVHITKGATPTLRA